MEKGKFWEPVVKYQGDLEDLMRIERQNNLFRMILFLPQIIAGARIGTRKIPVNILKAFNSCPCSLRRGRRS